MGKEMDLVRGRCLPSFPSHCIQKRIENSMQRWKLFRPAGQIPAVLLEGAVPDVLVAMPHEAGHRFGRYFQMELNPHSAGTIQKRLIGAPG